MTIAIDTAKLSAEQIDALSPLIQMLERRFHGALKGVFLYGSCLRSGDFFDGLVDLYLVVDNYQDAYHNTRLALGNRLLAPNVFYSEVESRGKPLRCKYSIVAADAIDQATSTKHFESYFWGRFAQPMAVIYCRQGEDASLFDRTLGRARETFLTKTLPALPGQGDVNQLWQQGLSLSYNTELRAEGKDRAASLVESNREFYLNAAREFARVNPELLTISQQEGDECYRSHFSRRQRAQARLTWQLRKFWGKLLSICRLVKALFTFEGGLDYIAWKLERHSGQKVEIPEKVRKHPLIHSWVFFWRLYRRGVFR